VTGGRYYKNLPFSDLIFRFGKRSCVVVSNLALFNWVASISNKLHVV
jgi:hypothetical protein